MSTQRQLIKYIKSHANPEKAQILSKFFKTWKWQYGEWDKFLGIIVPIIRNIVKNFHKSIDLENTEKLLSNKYHEIRLCALLILVKKFEKTDENTRKQIFDIYIKNTKYINNWDLVDLTAPNIVWEYLIDKDRNLLYKMMKSKLLWDQRIAILATFTFIKKLDFEDSIKICEYFLNHKHDLIHKATWWMLREMWKRNIKPLIKFLDKHYKIMPRTMLRYAIEKLDEKDRKYYMKRRD